MKRDTDIARLVKYETGYAINDIKNILKATDKVISDMLLKEPVIIKIGSFIFESKILEERTTMNPSTGKRYIKPKHLKCSIKPCPALKNKFYNGVINE